MSVKSAIATSSSLEPGYDVRVEPQRNLLLHMPVEDPAPCVEPVEILRGFGHVNPVVGQSLQRPYLRLNACRLFSNVLLLKTPSHASSPYVRKRCVRSLLRSPCRGRIK